ncbi:hypothetical protein LX16_4678 [Stackebrandtia albiflava]|uniref:PAP2 superfamily protein n=1 Tax=Stackebrandtia albiflava TaxID=406432 RepID=A0A562UQL8_9ACTN|nr:hypothetical protein [Stackebrandtia albiflava]TWJ07896.1 hypothetical protein LX16_4678 [Stackebrandtia albiflava]
MPDSPHRFALAVTHVFSPAAVITVLCLAVAASTTDPPSVALAWGLICALFTAGIPMTVIWLHMRRGRVTDVHIRERASRLRPLLAMIVSVSAGVALTLWWPAPPPMPALTLALCAGLVTTTAVTALWKMSFHTGVSAGAVAVLAAVYGWWASVGLAVVALIGWSRVRLRDHTVAQTVAGAAWGALVAGIVFTASR